MEIMAGKLPLPVDIQDIVACDERIAMRFQISGTHKAELLGASPTGRRVEFNAINMYCFEGNKNGRALAALGLGCRSKTNRTI
jgi:predicted ester cyclase